jgi:hypothetical protein
MNRDENPKAARFSHERMQVLSCCTCCRRRFPTSLLVLKCILFASEEQPGDEFAKYIRQSFIFCTY